MKTENAKNTIREMKFDDLPATFHLGEKLFTAERWTILYRTWDEYEIIERFLSDGELCFVATRNKKILGFTIGTIIEKSKGSWSYGYVCWLGVDPQLQSQGVGQKLINKLKRRFIEKGAKMMMVDTSGDNEKAINFFKKRGFNKTDPHVYMSKNLLDEPYYKTLKKRGDI